MTELDCLAASKPLQGGFPTPSKKHDPSAASPGERLGTDGDPSGERGAFAHKEYHRREDEGNGGSLFCPRGPGVRSELEGGPRERRLGWKVAGSWVRADSAGLGTEAGSLGAVGTMGTVAVQLSSVVPQSWVQTQEMDMSIVYGLSLARKLVER